MIRACALGLMIAAAAICRAQAPAPAGAPPGGEERRILVMLRIPPAHFRPDASYGGGYDAQSGRALRHHIASALASAHGLVLESDWPMVSLGVDCFLMTVADERPRPHTGRTWLGQECDQLRDIGVAERVELHDHRAVNPANSRSMRPREERGGIGEADGVVW